MNRVPFVSIWPARWKRNSAYLTLALLFIVLYYYRECTTHGSELAPFTTIADYVEQNRWPTVTGLSLLSLAAVTLGLGFLHETCHYLAIPNFRANGRFKFHWKSFTPSIACVVPLSKRRYIIAALAPLVIITPAAIVTYWLSHDIFIRTAALSAALLNIVGSANDVLTAKYVYSSKYVGFVEDHRCLIEYSTLSH